MKDKLGQNPAFPVNDADYDMNGIVQSDINGMNKRFYAACAAMQGLLANPNLVGRSDLHVPSLLERDQKIICTAYVMADELLKQENQ